MFLCSFVPFFFLCKISLCLVAKKIEENRNVNCCGYCYCDSITGLNWQFCSKNALIWDYLLPMGLIGHRASGKHMERMFGKVGDQGNRMLTRVLEHMFGMERKKKRRAEGYLKRPFINFQEKKG